MNWRLARFCVVLFSGCAAIAGHAQGGGQSETRPVGLRPGQWETVVAFNSVKAPGASAEQVEAMRAAVSAESRPASQCITPAQAANPMGNLAGAAAGGCTFTRNVFAGGVVDIAGSCDQGGEAPVELVMAGSYTAETIDAQIRTTARLPKDGAGGPERIVLSGRVTARRTGDCREGG